jgi:hypothetical protein
VTAQEWSADEERLGLPALVAAWEQFVQWERTFPPVDHRRWNRLADTSLPLERAAVADPAGVAAVERVASTHPDPAVRRHARLVLTPRPPVWASLAAEWLAHPLVGLGADALGVGALDVQQTIGFSAWHAGVSEPDEDPDEDYEVRHGRSAVGGRPLGPLPEWPRREDGEPLPLVAQIDLRDVLGSWDVEGCERYGVPVTGVLQLFHDLETRGDAVGDRARSAWHVRCCPTPSRPVRSPRPDGELPQVDLAGSSVVSLPHPDDVVAPEAVKERVGRARGRIEATLRAPEWTEGDDEHDLRPVVDGPIVSFLGHPSRPLRQVAALLAQVLPLTSDDDRWWRLLEVPAAFGLGHRLRHDAVLEVWVRRSDWFALRLDQAWVLVR